MNENFREDETSKSVENVVDEQKPKKVDDPFELENMKIRNKFEEEPKTNSSQVSDRCGSSYDASVSGTSAVSPLTLENPEIPTIFESPEIPTVLENPEIPTILENPESRQTPIQKENETTPLENEDQTAQLENQNENSDNENSGQNIENTQEPELNTNEEEAGTRQTLNLIQIHENPQASEQNDVQRTQEQFSTRKLSLGPPPSYSFVMKQKKKLKLPSIDPTITNRPPPPSYAGTRGLHETPEENPLERMCTLPSFGEPIWRSYSQPAFCNRCGAIILTTTHSHDSVATHVAALALCLFGCWPCCLLPYCMNVCKNTYHYCPVCQAFLGVYSPW